MNSAEEPLAREERGQHDGAECGGALTRGMRDKVYAVHERKVCWNGSYARPLGLPDSPPAKTVE